MGNVTRVTLDVGLPQEGRIFRLTLTIGRRSVQQTFGTSTIAMMYSPGQDHHEIALRPHHNDMSYALCTTAWCLHISWQLFSKVQQREQIAPLWKGQYAISSAS